MAPHSNSDSGRTFRAWNVVRVALGVLLLTAAGLKLAGQNVSAVPQVGWYATPMVQMAAVEWELILGVWLLSGCYRVGAWVASVATFLTFAGISGYLGWIGVASCGCFGAIKASPWYAFGVDVAVLAVLLVGRRSVQSLPERPRSVLRRSLQPAALGLVGVGLILGLFVGLATWRFGSMDAAFAALRGERVSVRPRVVDLGAVSAGDASEVEIRVVNRTDHPIRLIGGTAD